MKKVLLVPDSFKGTMSSIEISQIMSRGILEHFPSCEIVPIPVADGGEGTVDCFLTALGGNKVEVQVAGPYMDPMWCSYGVLTDGTAVIEMSASAGLPLVDGRQNPEHTTTYGVGQMILHAAKSGHDRIIVGLGGSCTNDGGAGAAAACGIQFFNAQGESFIPVGGTLSQVTTISTTGLDEQVRKSTIITMCDIDNPLTGQQGAAHVFAPQKGADEAMVLRLDQGLANLAAVIKSDIGADIVQLPGSGAAGGMGGGMVAFFHSTLQMGIHVVLDVVHFEDLLPNCSLVITGEGKIDEQSLRGKVVIGVAQRTAPSKVPVIAVVGDIGDRAERAYSMGVSAIFSTNRVAVDFRQAKAHSKQDLSLTMDNIMRFIKVAKGI